MEQVPLTAHDIVVEKVLQQESAKGLDATVVTTTPLKGAVTGAEEVTPEGADLLAQKLFPSPEPQQAAAEIGVPVIVVEPESGLAGSSPPMAAAELPPSAAVAEVDVEPPLGAGGMMEEKVPLIIPDDFEAGEKRGRSEISPTGAFEAAPEAGPPVKKAKSSPKKQSATASPAKKT